MTTSNPRTDSQAALGEDYGRRYLEALESSCFNIVRDSHGFGRDEDDKLAEIVIAIVKLHALCGGSIAIDAMGLSGGQVLLRLFSDRAFLEFLGKRPDFVKVVSVYQEQDRRADRRAVALAGFARTQDAGWHSSTFPEQEPIVCLSENILREGRIDPEELKSDTRPGSLGELLVRWPKYSPLLEGALNAAWHFTENSRAPFAAGSPSERVYEVLRGTLEKRIVVGDHFDVITSTMQFIERHCESGASASHSEIIRTVQTVETNSTQAMKLLQTASHAFNAALVATIEPDYGAYEFFPHGAPIGLYLNSPRDVLVATNFAESESTRILRLLRMCRFDWDPRDLHWTHVTKALSEADVVESGRKFQRVCRGGDPEEILESLHHHVQTLRKCLPAPPSFRSRPWAWVIGSIALIIGASAEFFLNLRGALAGAAAAARGGAKVVDMLAFGSSGYLMTEVLTDKIHKMIPREQLMDESQAGAKPGSWGPGV